MGPVKYIGKFPVREDMEIEPDPNFDPRKFDKIVKEIMDRGPVVLIGRVTGKTPDGKVIVKVDDA